MEHESMPSTVLSASKLCFGYSDGKPKVRSVDLSLRPGEVVALLGPNGAGKTSLLRVLSGTQAPNTGTVKVHHQNIYDLPSSDRARMLGYLPQGGADHGPFTVEEVVLMGRFAHGNGRVFETTEDHRVVNDFLKTFE